MQVVHWKWVATVEEAIAEAKAANLTVVALETVLFFLFFFSFFCHEQRLPLPVSAATSTPLALTCSFYSQACTSSSSSLRPHTIVAEGRIH
jgi:hypothetical protein